MNDEARALRNGTTQFQLSYAKIRRARGARWPKLGNPLQFWRLPSFDMAASPVLSAVYGRCFGTVSPDSEVNDIGNIHKL